MAKTDYSVRRRILPSQPEGRAAEAVRAHPQAVRVRGGDLVQIPAFKVTATGDYFADGGALAHPSPETQAVRCRAAR